MFITILGFREKPSDRSRSEIFLTIDDWNDYSFYTLFYLTYVNEQGQKLEIGSVKIGYFGQEKQKKARLLGVNDSFDKLDEKFFSLGQDDSYYDNLNKIGAEIRDKILDALNDIAKNEKLYRRAINEEVTKISLLRSVSQTSITGQFRRLTIGGARLSSYEFNFVAPKNTESFATSMELSFKVVPESSPPTNVHVLIGRNGVGKTRLLNNMIKTLVNNGQTELNCGVFKSEAISPEQNLFSNVISVSFSAFDETEPIKEQEDKTSGIHYSYIGLKRPKMDPDNELGPKSRTMLNEECVESVWACKVGSKSILWKRAIEMLESDPMFKDAAISSAIDIIEHSTFINRATPLFLKLSSGHKIVLLTVSKLVEKLEERSLVLMDEPEAHLHPPLLSALIRAISDLMIHKNGVAIIATHSPVILQEVPKSCVLTLRRNGAEAIVERLESESFGENVGALTREVFGLEVTNSGFHKLLNDAIEKENNYNSALNHFNGQLGMEAKSILRALSVERNGFEESI